MKSFIKKIRIRIGEKLLAQKLARRERRVIIRNIKDVETAAIVFDASASENIYFVKQFVKQLKEYGIKTKVLGYINKTREHIDLISDHKALYINKEDFTFFYVTKDEAINKFIDEPFHLMIIYCEHDYFPLRYIGMLSAAELKVGESGLCEDIPDVVFDLHENRGLPGLQKQIFHYLSIINKHD